ARIPQERCAELTLLEGQTHREAANAGHRDKGIARQLLDRVFGQVGERNAARGQGEVPDDGVRFLVNGDVAHTGAASHVLRCLFAQVLVEWIAAAGKVLAVMLRRKRLYAEPTAHRVDEISLL